MTWLILNPQPEVCTSDTEKVMKLKIELEGLPEVKFLEMSSFLLDKGGRKSDDTSWVTRAVGGEGSAVMEE